MDETAVSSRPNTPLPPTETVTPDIFKQSTYNTSDFPPSQPQITEPQISITTSVPPLLEKLARIENASNITPIIEPTTENGPTKAEFNQAVELKMKQNESFNNDMNLVKNGELPENITMRNGNKLADIINRHLELKEIMAAIPEAANNRFVKAADTYIVDLLKQEFGQEDGLQRVYRIILARTIVREALREAGKTTDDLINKQQSSAK